MSEDVELYQGNALSTDLSVSRAPAIVLKEAREAAVALQDVISHKKKPVIFNGEQYLEFEDWQTIARLYGITAKVRETRFVQFGDVQGFEATADAILVSNGQAISSADAMCLNDEEKWSTRTKYEWSYILKSGGTSIEDPGKDEIIWEDNPDKPGKKRPKKERVMIGEERVPLFQLKSMSQTRACAKCLRNVLAWVAVLAGYRPTPAEELPTDDCNTSPKPPIQQPQRKSDSPKPLIDDQSPANNEGGAIAGPQCPKCSGPMKLLPAGKKKDGNPYPAFWSCSAYPACKGTVKDSEWHKQSAPPTYAEGADPDPATERQAGQEG